MKVYFFSDYYFTHLFFLLPVLRRMFLITSSLATFFIPKLPLIYSHCCYNGRHLSWNLVNISSSHPVLTIIQKNSTCSRCSVPFLCVRCFVKIKIVEKNRDSSYQSLFAAFSFHVSIILYSLRIVFIFISLFEFYG